MVGFDTGPGNTLLGQWVGIHRGAPYDKDGTWGGGGTSCQALLEALLADPYFERSPPTSTGREYFKLEWLNQRLARLAQPPAPQAVQVTLLQVTARSVADAIDSQLDTTAVDQVFVCGGGWYLALMSALENQRSHIPVARTDALGPHRPPHSPGWPSRRWTANRAICPQ